MSKKRPAVLCGAVVALLGAIGASSAMGQTGQYDGVNWADPRDNFADDALLLSGISVSDDYATTREKARRVAQEFYDKLGANTVRIPINPATVNSTRWTAYRGVIDGLRAGGAKVIVAYWEGTDRDGKIDNRTAFDSMWATVVAAYSSQADVLFEPMNEPHGYSLAEWSGIAASWVARFPFLPRGQMIIDGSGYSEDVRGICADSRLNGTLVGIHNYAFWANRSYDQWLTDWRGKLAPCTNRTIVTEYGVTMNSGHDFNKPSSNNEVMFMQAANRIIRENGAGGVYWPGLRDGDSYSITVRNGTNTRRSVAGSNITLNVVNSTARDSIRWGWGM